MFELPSARTFITGGSEFLFARFYDVYEGVQLVQLESPPIVSGVPDMHPSDSQNVEETRNLMQTSNWKKYSHFSPTNIPSAFPTEICICASYNAAYHISCTKKGHLMCSPLTSLYYFLLDSSSFTFASTFALESGYISNSASPHNA